MSVDYVICVRNVKKGAFGAEPGPTKFLFVPDDQLPSPEHAVRKSEWVRQVRDDAEHTTDPITQKRYGDMLVYIHGFNNDQKIVMDRHRQLKKDLAAAGFEGTLISYDWPSNDQALNYIEDRIDAKQTALRLVTDCIELVARYQQRDCTINVHLLAHSTGAYVIREAFDDADDRPRIASAAWTASQIMFIGADISSGSMSAGNPKTSSLFRHSVRITNYWNPYDTALKMSDIKRIGVAPRVGRIGLPNNAPSGCCVDVNCGPHWSTLDPDQATYFGSFSHSWHIGDPLFTEDLLHTIRGNIDRHSIPTRKLVDGKLVLGKNTSA